ncbi:MAG: hypothetical protein GX191_07950 [Candidatus Methanoculleus thermohydrogenotrophicum]|nr:hypothetical protein [Candidatus Methanoculleus thermohydrogenotrophicum]
MLLTGSGQCNVTRGGEITAFLSTHGDHGVFLRPVLIGYKPGGRDPKNTARRTELSYPRRS